MNFLEGKHKMKQILPKTVSCVRILSITILCPGVMDKQFLFLQDLLHFRVQKSFVSFKGQRRVAEFKKQCLFVGYFIIRTKKFIAHKRFVTQFCDRMYF